MSWHTYVINLAGANERWSYVSSQLDELGLPYTRVEGINGYALDFPVEGFSELSYRLLHGRKINPGAVGCYLSHIEAITQFLNSDHAHALILEDDARLPEDLVEILEAGTERERDWDILRLSTVNSGRKFPVARLTEGRSLAVAITREKGAGAYVLNRKAAELFRRRLVPMRLSWDIAFDVEYLYGLKALFVVPVPVNQRTGFSSSTEDHTGRKWRLPAWRYLTVFPYRMYLESGRVVRRTEHYLRLRWHNRKDRAPA